MVNGQEFIYVGDTCLKDAITKKVVGSIQHIMEFVLFARNGNVVRHLQIGIKKENMM